MLNYEVYKVRRAPVKFFSLLKASRKPFTLKLSCLLYIVVTLFSWPRGWWITSNNKLQSTVERFVEGCVFSDSSLTRERVAVTVSRLTDHKFLPASVSCETSSGTMRIVKYADIRNMCWYANDFIRITRRVQRKYRQLDFIVCDRDCRNADKTVFSFAKTRQITSIRDRTVTVLPVNVGRHFKWVPRALNDPWAYQSKLPIALWRGVSTGECWDLDSAFAVHDAGCARRNLVLKWSLSESPYVDVGLTALVQTGLSIAVSLRPFLKKPKRVQEMLKYKYLISVEGNDVATNLKWALASNSVVLMPPPTRESFILEGNLLPWVHYVPLKASLEDLAEKVLYCEQNITHCKDIATASTQYMRMFATRKNLFYLGARAFEAHFEKIFSVEL